jgi:hypothetical protein
MSVAIYSLQFLELFSFLVVLFILKEFLLKYATLDERRKL